VTYTSRFEQWVLDSLWAPAVEEVGAAAGRFGREESSKTSMEYQLAGEREIPPERVVSSWASTS